jgi:hypothetical protein
MALACTDMTKWQAISSAPVALQWFTKQRRSVASLADLQWFTKISHRLFTLGAIIGHGRKFRGLSCMPSATCFSGQISTCFGATHPRPKESFT